MKQRPLEEASLNKGSFLNGRGFLIPTQGGLATVERTPLSRALLSLADDFRLARERVASSLAPVVTAAPRLPYLLLLLLLLVSVGVGGRRRGEERPDRQLHPGDLYATTNTREADDNLKTPTREDTLSRQNHFSKFFQFSRGASKNR